MDADYLDQLVQRGVISPDVLERMTEGEPQRQSRMDILRQGLDTARDYLTPSYFRDTPSSPQADRALADPNARPGKIGPPSGPPTGMQIAGGLAGDVAANALPLGKVLAGSKMLAGYTAPGGSPSAIFGNPEKTARFFELLSQQKNPTEIAKELGVGRTTIRRMMAHEDIKNTNFGGGKSVFRDATTGAPIPEKLDELRRLHAQGLPSTWIAAKMGTTDTSIDRWLDTLRQTGEMPTRGTPYKPVTKFQQREAPAPDQDYAKALRELGLAL